MREEYDLKKLKVKRRGLLPELKDKKKKPAKVRITISQEIPKRQVDQVTGRGSVLLYVTDNAVRRNVPTRFLNVVHGVAGC